MTRPASSVRTAFDKYYESGSLKSYSIPYHFKMTDRNVEPSTTNTGSSLVHDPVFRALYQDAKHQLYFAETKKQFSFAVLSSNQELQDWITENEPGKRIDYAWIQKSLDALGREIRLEGQSPGLFRFFNALLTSHGHYCNAAAKFHGYDIWRLTLEAYYTASDDILVKELFMANKSVDLKDYLHQAVLTMTPEASASRRTQSTVYLEELHLAETWLHECKGRDLEARLTQLRKLNEIHESKAEKYASGLKAHKQIKQMQIQCFRAQKRAAIRIANAQHFNHQLGRERQNPMSTISINAQVAQNSAWTAAYVNSELPSVLEQIQIEGADEHVSEIAIDDEELDN